MIGTRMLPSLTNFKYEFVNKNWKIHFSRRSPSSVNYATEHTVYGKKFYFPKKPEKPLPPYKLFCQKKYATEFSKMHPKPLLTDVIRQIAEAWKQVDTEIKEKMMNEYKENKQKHDAALQQYYSSLNDTELADLEISEEYRKKLIKKIRLKRALKKSGKPSRPVNAFGRFLKDEYSKMAGESKTSYSQNNRNSIFIEISKKWNRLTPEEKAPYNLQFEEAHKEYRQSLAEWEKEMVRQGKGHLIKGQIRPAIELAVQIMENVPSEKYQKAILKNE